MRINVTSGETAQRPIPSQFGKNPVGMITVASGPLSGVWFGLAGDATGGSGTFALAQLPYTNTVAGQWLPAQALTDPNIYDQGG
jgi:hypothetical protein